ncbi:MAG: hypothetical protein M1817_001389 [Caeruleum heppii]|nr:MAG: hypothetical protein M1817_001389 [Caeruleum heppii]
MKQTRKRAREDDPEAPEPASKHHRSRSIPSPPAPPPPQQKQASLPTPAPTVASPKPVHPFSQRPQTPSEAGPDARKQFSGARSEPKRSRYRRQRPSASRSRAAETQAAEPRTAVLQAAEPPSAYLVDTWLRNTPQSRVVQERIQVRGTGEVEGSGIIPTIEGFSELEAVRDQLSQLQDEESTQERGSTVSARLETTGPMYRAALKMNRIVIDNFGDRRTPEIVAFLDKNMRKARSSPPLEENTKISIKRKILEVWDSPEPAVSDIITAPLFDLANPAITSGCDILWSPKPSLPRSTDYPLITPQIDRHVGFQPTLKSKWTRAELATADHPRVRPYSQPTRENLFPSILFEIKSEATGGTLYGAEAQLATAGAHRVISLLWILDQTDPNRTRSSTDGIVISYAVDQRETVEHVHFYNPEDDTFYMSYIDSFYFAKDLQHCRDHAKNAVEWMVEVQQPKLRDALKALHPITQT